MLGSAAVPCIRALPTCAELLAAAERGVRDSPTPGAPLPRPVAPEPAVGWRPGPSPRAASLPRESASPAHLLACPGQSAALQKEQDAHLEDLSLYPCVQARPREQVAAAPSASLSSSWKQDIGKEAFQCAEMCGYHNRPQHFGRKLQPFLLHLPPVHNPLHRGSSPSPSLKSPRSPFGEGHCLVSRGPGVFILDIHTSGLPAWCDVFRRADALLDRGRGLTGHQLC